MDLLKSMLSMLMMKWSNPNGLSQVKIQYSWKLNPIKFQKLSLMKERISRKSTAKTIFGRQKDYFINGSPLSLSFCLVITKGNIQMYFGLRVLLVMHMTDLC